MDWSIQDWGALGEILSGIAVLATLVYLAVQTKQANASAQASSYSAWAEGTNHIIHPALVDSYLSQLLLEGWENGPNKDTWLSFMWWHLQLFYHVDAVLQMHRNNAVGDQTLELELNRAITMLHNEEVMKLWYAGMRTQVSSELREILEQRLEQGGLTWVRWSEEEGYHAWEREPSST